MSLDDVLARLHQLPMLSVVIQEVLASFKDDHLDLATLAYKISQDQGLSAKILRVANSPFYGLSRKVASVHDAALVIGFDSIRSLALSAGFMLAFPHPHGNLFDWRAYWLRSFRVACYTEAMAKLLGQDQQVAFSAGMFYDIGQLVLDICIPEQFAVVLTQQEISGSDLIEIEQSILGFDHALIGAEMAKRWNFPHEIEHAIRYWRTPEHAPFERYTGMVHVAVLLENGLRGDALINPLAASLFDRLQLTLERLEAGMPEPDQLDAVENLMLEA